MSQPAPNPLLEIDPEELRENFAFFDEWEDRYRYIIDLGRKLPPYDEADKTEEYRIHGCQSMVWLRPDLREEDGQRRLYFNATSDAMIVQGLIAILVVVYCGRPPGEIQAFDIRAYIESLGLTSHLSPTRSNGLYAMVERIQALAQAAG